MRVYHFDTESELAWYLACLECGANEPLGVVKKSQRPKALSEILSAERHNVIKEGLALYCR